MSTTKREKSKNVEESKAKSKEKRVEAEPEPIASSERKRPKLKRSLTETNGNSSVESKTSKKTTLDADLQRKSSKAAVATEPAASLVPATPESTPDYLSLHFAV